MALSSGSVGGAAVVVFVVVPESAAGSAAGSVVVLVAWETTAVVVVVVVAGLFVERSAPAVVVREGAGATHFGECIGPSSVFFVAGSAAVEAAGVAGKLVSAGVRAEATAQASGTNTFASGERRNALAGRRRAGTRQVPVPVPTGRRPRRLRRRKRRVVAARVSVELWWLPGR